MKLLIATDRDFWKADIGSRKRIAQLCSFLSGTSLEVHLFLTFAYPADAIEAIRQQFGFKSIRLYSPKMPGRLHRRLTNRIRERLKCAFCPTSDSGNQELTLSEFSDNRVKIQFDRFVDEICPDLILIEYIRLAYLIDSIPRSIKTIIDTHDVMHLRYESFKKTGKPHWLKISKEEEVAVLNRFDAVLAIQQREKEFFQDVLNKRTAVLHAGMDSILEFLPGPDDEVLTIGFIGAHGDPNVEGIMSFIDKIWPLLVHSTNKKLKLVIAGSICDVLPKENFGSDIVLLGRVEEVQFFYRQTNIIINPVTFGGGLKIKTVEALAYGKPLVSTPVGAVGLEDGAGEAFRVAKTEEDFFKNLEQLIKCDGDRKKLAKCAFDYAEKHFSAEIVYQDLSSFLEL